MFSTPAFVSSAPVAPRVASPVHLKASSSETPEPPKAPKATFGNVMGFSGVGPEIINARAAMLAIPIAAIWESASNRTTFDLMSSNLVDFGLLVGLLSAASLIPIFKGAKEESLGPMSPKAEMLNGRTAMVGFAALLLIEANAGTCFF